MDKVKLPDFYFSFQVFWLRLTGIELLKENESLQYRVYSIICFSFTAVYVVMEYIEITRHSDFNTISIISCYIINDTLALARVAVIYRNRKRIGYLLKSFHEGFYKPNAERGGNFEHECISNVLRESRLQTNHYGIFLLITLAAGLAASLKSRLTQSNENWALPFNALSLVDIASSPGFELMYLYQGTVVPLLCFWTYVFDCTVIAVIALIGAQLRILERCIRKYRHSVTFSKSSCLLNNALIDNIKFHLNLIETVDEVEELCHYLVLCVFVANLVNLCLIMYHTSLTPIKSLEFFNYLLYTFSLAVQILLYCWWGNEMTLANQALGMGIYESYNPDDPVINAKVLKLMLVKTQKPLFFTAGKFVPLSIDTYKGIIKASFSYFTVLRQVNTK